MPLPMPCPCHNTWQRLFFETIFYRPINIQIAEGRCGIKMGGLPVDRLDGPAIVKKRERERESKNEAKRRRGIDVAVCYEKRKKERRQGQLTCFSIDA